jgi:hypothetical protein
VRDAAYTNIRIQPDYANQAVLPFYYFLATGHTLRGAFARYWGQHGGLAIYGYPISGVFTEINPDNNQPYQVQYFECARFEAHPELAGSPYEVLLGLLGNELLHARGWR